MNASVAGYPAIHDIGIPEGSDTPIYDKVMWIADGVLYTVSGNGLDSGSMSLANSSVVLQAPAAPAPTDPPVVEQPAPTEPPVVEQPPAETGEQNTGVTEPAPNPSNSGNSTNTETGSTTADTETTSETNQSPNVPDTNDVIEESEETPDDAGVGDDGTSGPWYTGNGMSEEPSDGTAGPNPPHLGPSDGTGGAP